MAGATMRGVLYDGEPIHADDNKKRVILHMAGTIVETPIDETVDIKVKFNEGKMFIEGYLHPTHGKRSIGFFINDFLGDLAGPVLDKMSNEDAADDSILQNQLSFSNRGHVQLKAECALKKGDILGVDYRFAHRFWAWLFKEST